MASHGSAPVEKQFPCKGCGASLHFQPGTTSLTCPYCGAVNQIEQSPDRVEELDFNAAVAQLERAAPQQEVLAVKCNVCGAESTLGPNVTADVCPFCGSAIVATAASKKQFRPGSLLPFHITRQQAQAAFSAWLSSRWFAPSSLTKLADSGALRGLYLPAWTYDAGTLSRYTGQRGDDYWVTESYTAFENGKHVTKTRQVRKTRWSYASGAVANAFDDVLVPAAGNSLPQQHLDALEPWDLQNVLPYKDDYLSGFVAQSYQVSLTQGFDRARQIMDVTIRSSIARDIGGDHQRIDSVDTRYHHVTFKYLLLPVWLSAYRYHDTLYHFLVNARTGEVRGDRPYSFWKIFLFTLLCLALAATILLIANVASN